MGDHVYHTFPITIDMLLRIFQSFQPRNVFHACIRAAFLVTFFSFLRISTLVPYTLSDVHSSASFFLRRRDITFTASGAYLHVFKTKTFSSSKRSWRYPFPLFLKCCVSSIGEDPTHFSSRSFRKGGATFAFNCGAPIEFIKAQGDWKSDASLVYLTLSSSKKLALLNAIRFLFLLILSRPLIRVWGFNFWFAHFPLVNKDPETFAPFQSQVLS